MKAIKDKEFEPQVRSKLALDKIKREYGEFDDLPNKVLTKDTDMVKARLIISFLLSGGLFSRDTIKAKIMKDYNLSEENLLYVSDWYVYSCFILSYKLNDIEIWTRMHSQYPKINTSKLSHSEPETCRRIYRRILILAQSDRVSPVTRVNILKNAYNWYVNISPEMVPKNNKLLEEMLAMNEGNLKYAVAQVEGYNELAWGLYSMGNVKLARHFTDRLLQIRVDSEAIEDQKSKSWLKNIKT